MESSEVLLETSRFRVVRHHQVIPGGIRVRESIQHPGAVAIIPVLDGGRICLIRNFRIAVGRTLIEIPAGTLDRDEDPQTAAARELIEETGYRAGSLAPLGQLSMSPGILNERMHIFVATGLTPGEPSLEPGEEIQTFILAMADAIQMIGRGEIEDAKTVAALLMYERFWPSG